MENLRKLVLGTLASIFLFAILSDFSSAQETGAGRYFYEREDGDNEKVHCIFEHSDQNGNSVREKVGFYYCDMDDVDYLLNLAWEGEDHHPSQNLEFFCDKYSRKNKILLYRKKHGHCTHKFTVEEIEAFLKQVFTSLQEKQISLSDDCLPQTSIKDNLIEFALDHLDFPLLKELMNSSRLDLRSPQPNVHWLRSIFESLMYVPWIKGKEKIKKEKWFHQNGNLAYQSREKKPPAIFLPDMNPLTLGQTNFMALMGKNLLGNGSFKRAYDSEQTIGFQTTFTPSEWVLIEAKSYSRPFASPFMERDVYFEKKLEELRPGLIWPKYKLLISTPRGSFAIQRKFQSDLMQWLEDNQDQLAAGDPETIAKAMKFFKEIVHQLTVYHQLNLVHKDLKPENVAIVDNGTNAFINDFDFAEIKDDHEDEIGKTRQFIQVVKKGTLGSVFAISPSRLAYKNTKTPYTDEMIQNGEAFLLDRQSDDFALGVLAVEILRFILGRPDFELPDQIADNPTVPLDLNSPEMKMVRGKYFNELNNLKPEAHHPPEAHLLYDIAVRLLVFEDELRPGGHEIEEALRSVGTGH